MEIVEQTPDVSFVMPTFNEERNIIKAVQELHYVAGSLDLNYEIIVVDDGSMDSTLAKVMEHSKSNDRVRIVSYQKNMGKGFAVKTGFSNARGNNIVFIDSDLDIDPNLIKEYLETLKNVEMVIASKWHPQSKVQMRSIRKFFSRSFNVLVRLLTGTKMKDTQTGLKAVNKDALEKTFSKLTVKRYAYDVELLTVANRNGVAAVELPVYLKMPKLFKFKDVFRMFVDLLGIAYRLKIRRYC